ncbi:MAG: DNA polymerase III subunit gamma/tau [Ignavibacteriales bacterium]|nr:DNA polymerase III subunit gamma/tau [Ignavibacteriales bacterium]
MTFVVTARKWRPQLFSKVVGQQHITTTLKNAIENDRIGHAYIFAGPRGVGKTTTARILAKRLNCEIPNGGEPCNECSSCNNFLKSQSLDIIEIDGASNRRIDEIRTLRESVKYAPTSGEYKVYIIDEVHMLTTESFNALLKTLEEPPEHTIFIFATTDIHKVPLTIISRCQRFDFRRIELDEIKNLLKQISDSEKIKIDDDSLTLIAKKADGALRDAESIFDQVVSFCGKNVDVNILKQMLNLIDDETYFQVSEALLDKDFKVAFEISDKIYSNGWNFIDFVNGLVEHFRNITTVVITKSANFIETSENLKEKYLKYENRFSEGDLLRILSFLNKTQNELRNSQNQKLKVEISLTHLIGLEKSSTISELLSQKGNLDFEVKKKSSDLKTPIQIEQKIETIVQNADNFEKKEQTPNNNTPKSSIKDNKNKEDNNKPASADAKKIESIENIIKNWDNFKSTISSERFTLGPLLDHTFPAKIANNILHVDVNHKEDVSILESSNDFLSKRISSIFNSNIKLSFKYNKTKKAEPINNSVIEFTEEHDPYKDHPLVKSIVSELGGREIK